MTQHQEKDGGMRRWMDGDNGGGVKGGRKGGKNKGQREIQHRRRGHSFGDAEFK